jgi:CTP-dependent riboflavin kinase
MRTVRNRRLRGRVVSGRGEAAGFTRLPWVQAQVAQRLGFVLYPGTLNLEVEPADDAAMWKRLRTCSGVAIDPAPGYCPARCYPVSVEGQISAAILLPLVPEYPERSVEVIAPVSLRETLHLGDGHVLTLILTQFC